MISRQNKISLKVLVASSSSELLMRAQDYLYPLQLQRSFLVSSDPIQPSSLH